MSKDVNPDAVLKYTGPTKSFLCPLNANTYGIDFLAFKIRDMDSGKVVFEVAKDENAQPVEYPQGFDYDLLRTIAYKFPAEFLRYRTVGTTLRFKVGPNEVKNFRMIERHYFKNQLIQSYDFNFHYCIPNSTNEWEVIYDVPRLTDERVAEIVANPNETKSDSFYFVEDNLVMHNKASYAYVEAEQKSTASDSKSNKSSSTSTSTSKSQSTSSTSSSSTKEPTDKKEDKPNSKSGKHT